MIMVMIVIVASAVVVTMVVDVIVRVFFTGRAAAHKKQRRNQERKKRFHSAGTVGAGARYFKLNSLPVRNRVDKPCGTVSLQGFFLPFSIRPAHVFRTRKW